MRRIKEALHESDWSYDPPKLIPEPTAITTWKGVESVLTSPQSFMVPYNTIVGSRGDYQYILNGGSPVAKQKRAEIWRALRLSDKAVPAFSRSIKDLTQEAIRQCSNKLRNILDVDAAGDIAALSWTRFTARLFGIRAKSEVTDSKKLYDSFRSIYTFMFHDTDVVNSLTTRKKVVQAYKSISSLLKPVCEAVQSEPPSKLLQNIAINLFNDNLLPDHGICLLRRLFESGRSVDDVVDLVILLASSIAILGAQTLIYMLDLFLSEPYHATHWREIQTLAFDTSPAACEKLHQYVLEAIRLTCPVISNLRFATQDTTIDDGQTPYSIKSGQSVILDIAKASRDPIAFPHSDEVQPNRSESYQHLLFGFGSPLSEEKEMIVAGLTEQLRIFAGLKNLRRAPGPAGQLGSRKVGAVTKFISDARDGWDPLPTSLKLLYDN